MPIVLGDDFSSVSLADSAVQQACSHDIESLELGQEVYVPEVNEIGVLVHDSGDPEDELRFGVQLSSQDGTCFTGRVVDTARLHSEISAEVFVPSEREFGQLVYDSGDPNDDVRYTVQLTSGGTCSTDRVVSYADRFNAPSGP